MGPPEYIVACALPHARTHGFAVSRQPTGTFALRATRDAAVARAARLVMGRHQVPWLNASTAAASNLEELAYHYGTDKSHDDHKCVQLRPHTAHPPTHCLTGRTTTISRVRQ